ncbi:MAG TPA: glycerol-3-phosphate 1-O-acyltransferase [Rhodobacterales bacterium]|nr:glycerol-3-phosphate 1-O-acyltransferase [Rhodobacterales bacterium]
MPEITTSLPLLALTALLGYLLGSAPFGMVWARVFGLGDIRTIGSGNIGATNVLRTGNKLAALLTLIGDVGKGAFAVLVARALLGDDAAQTAGLFAYLGHLFPVYIGFKGGKGVATWLGTMLAVAWPVGLAAAATWAATAALFRISSLAGLTAAALTPIWALLTGRGEVFVLALLLGALIFERHRANIARLLRGEEPKIGKK